MTDCVHVFYILSFTVLPQQLSHKFLTHFLLITCFQQSRSTPLQKKLTSHHTTLHTSSLHTTSLHELSATLSEAKPLRSNEVVHAECRETSSDKEEEEVENEVNKEVFEVELESVSEMVYDQQVHELSSFLFLFDYFYFMIVSQSDSEQPLSTTNNNQHHYRMMSLCGHLLTGLW